MDKETALILTQSKSIGVGLLITWLFGGFGVFYVSVLGGVVMGILELILWVLSFFTMGLALILLAPVHILSMIWVYMGVKNHNKRLIAGLGSSPASAAPAINSAAPVATPD